MLNALWKYNVGLQLGCPESDNINYRMRSLGRGVFKKGTVLALTFDMNLACFDWA